MIFWHTLYEFHLWVDQTSKQKTSNFFVPGDFRISGSLRGPKSNFREIENTIRFNSEKLRGSQFPTRSVISNHDLYIILSRLIWKSWLKWGIMTMYCFTMTEKALTQPVIYQITLVYARQVLPILYIDFLIIKVPSSLVSEYQAKLACSLFSLVWFSKYISEDKTLRTNIW